MMRGTATPACEFIFAVVSFDGFEAYDSKAPGPNPDLPRNGIGGPPARAQQNSSRYALVPVVRTVGAPARSVFVGSRLSPRKRVHPTPAVADLGGCPTHPPYES